MLKDYSVQHRFQAIQFLARPICSALSHTLRVTAFIFLNQRISPSRDADKRRVSHRSINSDF